MTERDNAELFTRLAELCRLCPEMRFGQLIANLAVVARGTESGAVWDMDDDELLTAANWQLAQLSGRTVEVA